MGRSPCECMLHVRCAPGLLRGCTHNLCLLAGPLTRTFLLYARCRRHTSCRWVMHDDLTLSPAMQSVPSACGADPASPGLIRALLLSIPPQPGTVGKRLCSICSTCCPPAFLQRAVCTPKTPACFGAPAWRGLLRPLPTHPPICPLLPAAPPGAHSLSAGGLPSAPADAAQGADRRHRGPGEHRDGPQEVGLPCPALPWPALACPALPCP